MCIREKQKNPLINPKTKDEAPGAIIKCIKNIQVRLNATVQNVRIDNGTELVNQTLHEFYENVGISHQTSVARTPQQNSVVERRNRTLVEAAQIIDDWDQLFQPMFYEYFNPLIIVVSPVQEAAAPRAEVLADSPVSISISQDAPSTKNGNSFKLVRRTTANADGTSTSTILGPDAKTLFESIQARFSGNDTIKKTQRTLLKQIYENFNAPSTESLDSIFNRLQKIISQLAILGENISQEDLNMKFLRSLPSEWNTHVVVWRNKADLDTISIDDLYNNFKIVEQEVKKNSCLRLKLRIVKHGLSFLSGKYQLVHEDLEQIHKDDLEEIDLKWLLALLSIRARRYFQRTRKKITINGSDIAGYDKTNVDYFNCHKTGHFARECRNPRNQDSMPRNQDSSKKTVNVEDTSSKAMVAVNRSGFD
nr:ribonuclease H-like domain-containing protein [Tanacetum cinerariifolium]